MEVEHLKFAYGDKPVLQDISFTVSEGKITTLLGANGCGKTTLLRLMTRNLKPDSGTVRLDGVDILRLRAREFARAAAIVHQKNTAPDDLTVKKLVGYGRLPHSSLLFSGGAENEKKIAWAIEATGRQGLENRPMGALSGGQRQRAFIAMALAQDTKLLFLDEPTTFLDVRYQVELLRLIRRLNRELGLTIVMVLHDINQALAYSDEVIGLKDGRILVRGAPEKVIDETVIETLYDIRLPLLRQDGRQFVLAV